MALKLESWALEDLLLQAQECASTEARPVTVWTAWMTDSRNLAQKLDCGAQQDGVLEAPDPTTAEARLVLALRRGQQATATLY